MMKILKFVSKPGFAGFVRFARYAGRCPRLVPGVQHLREAHRLLAGIVGRLFWVMIDCDAAAAYLAVVITWKP
jgi:hypothetical protein